MKKIKSSTDRSKFGKKNIFRSIIKHSHLLETLIQTLKREKMRAKVPQLPDTKDFNEQSKRHKAEKKLRAQILKLDEDEAKIRLLKENAELKLKDFESQINMQQKKQQLLEDLSQRAKFRQEELQRQKKVLHESPQCTKPKYIEMVENYKQHFEIPELKRRKDELAKKRMLYQPISRQDWLEHMKKYNNLSIEAEKKRMKSLEEKSFDSVHLVNKTKKEMELQNELMKKNMKSLVEKRKHYGQIVREVFAPKVEVKEKIKEKISEKNEKVRKIHDIRTSIDQIPKVVKELKRKIKKLESKTPDVKIEKLDYLAEKRKERSAFRDYDVEFPKVEINVNEEKSKALQNLKKIDQILLSHNHRLRNSDPSNLQSLELEANINDLLTQSIKAKLSLL